MADPVQLPSFQDYLDAGRAPPMSGTGSGSVSAPQTPQASGTGGWLSAGLGSGFYGALADVGSAGQAVAKATGFDSAAQAAQDFAARQSVTAATYANPQYEDNPWSPGGLAYHLAQAVPAMAGMIGAGALIPEEAAAAGGAATAAGVGGLRGFLLGKASLRGVLGAGATAFPLAVGQNVQRQEEYSGDLSQGQAQKALALGVPEAAVQAILPARIAGAFAQGVGGNIVDKILYGAKVGVPAQAGVGALTEYLTQQMGDPNRSFADRAQSVVQSALGGAFQGLVFGGGLHALAKTPPAQVDNDAMKNAIDPTLSGEPAPTIPTNPVQEAPPSPPAQEAPVETPPEPAPPIDPATAEHLAYMVRGYSDEHLKGLYDQFAVARNNGQMTPDGVAFHDIMDAELQQRETQKNALKPAFEEPTSPPAAPEAAPAQGAVQEPTSPPPMPEAAPAQGAAQEPTSPPPTPEATPAQGTQPAPFDWNAVKRDNPKLPKAFKAQDFTSEDQLKDAVAAHINERDQAGNDPNNKIVDLAKKLGVVDDTTGEVTWKGTPAPDAAQEAPAAPAPVPQAAPAAAQEAPAAPELTPPAQVSRAPARDDILPVHQPRWDLIEKVRALAQKIGADPDFTDKVDTTADDLQTRLLNPENRGPNHIGTIGKETLALQNTVTNEANRQAILAKAGTARDQDYYTKPLDETTTQPPTAQAVREVEAIKAKMKAAQPADTSAVDQRVQQAVRDQQKASGNDPRAFLSDVRSRLSDIARPDLDASLKRLHETPDNGFQLSGTDNPKNDLRGQTGAKRAQGGVDYKGEKMVVAHQDEPTTKRTQAAAPTQAAASAMPDALTNSVLDARDSLNDLKEGAKTRRPEDQQALNAALKIHEARLNRVANAVASGDRDALSTIQPGHFLNPSVDDALFGKLDKASQKLFGAHFEKEEDVLDAVRGAVGSGPVPLLDANREPVTQYDRDLLYKIHSTNDTYNGGYILSELMRDGSTSAVRRLAKIFYDAGINPRVRLAGPGDPIHDYLTRQGDDLGRVMGSYSANTDRIGIHSADHVEATVLHEMAHAATLRAIEHGTQGAKEMNALYDWFKTKYGDQQFYGMTNVKEFVAEAFSNSRFQRFLMNEEAPSNWTVRSVWEGFKNAVAHVLGLTPTTRSMFDTVMDVAHDLVRENQGLEDSRYSTPVALVDDGLHEASRGADAVYRRTFDAMRESVSGAALNTKESWRKQALSWLTSPHISKVFGKLIPATRDFTDIQKRESIRSDTFAKHTVKAYAGLDRLEKTSKHAAEELMAYTMNNTSPWLKYEQQPWLHGTDKNAGVREQVAREANAKWNNFARVPGNAEAYHAARLSNEADRLRHQATLTRDMMRSDINDKVYPGFESDPAEDYEREYGAQDDPVKAAAFWKNVVDRQRQGVTQFMNELSAGRSSADARLKTDKTLTDEQRQSVRNEKNRLSRNYNLIKSLMDDRKASDKRAGEGAYFNLGRNGTHFVAGHIAVDPTGEVNAENAGKLSDLMQAEGFGDAVIAKGTENTSVYVRVRDASEMERLHKVFVDARNQGVLAPDMDISRGEAGTTDIYKALSPAWMQHLIGAVRDTKPDVPEGVDDATRDILESAHKQQLRDLTRIMLNMTPENSLSRIYAHRENVQGFSAHMIKSFGQAGIASARGVSRISLANDMSQAMRDMKDQVRANNENTNLKSNQVLGGAQAVAELIQREKNRDTSTPGSFMDAIRKMTHTFQVGSSPTYVFTVGTQLGTLSLAQLGSTHGFAKAAISLAKAAPLATKFLDAVAHGSDPTRFGIRQEDLVKGNLSKADVDFFMYHATKGDFHDISYTQSMTGHGPLSEGKVGKIFSAANALGLFAEMMPRAVTAIAARDLYNQKPYRNMSMHDFVSHSVSESQMDWGASGNPRQVTRQGMFGAMSPLINQFMGFSIRLTELLYRKAADAVGKVDPSASPEVQASQRLDAQEARKFLLGHAAAVTMMAGTLGLPMLATAASVYDRLKDLVTGEDNNDVVASYRSFLANTFGKQAGEIIARGLPRAFGADFDHVGEGRIAPGSTFLSMLTEKRSLEDAEKDWLKSEAGSATGFLINIAGAARDFTNGDYMNGLIKMVPEALKSPAEAYRIADRGFVDKNGQKLPITANGFDIAMKALGIDPAKEAEYDEVKRTQTGLNTMRQLREKNITQHLQLAANRGDPAMMDQWLAQSQAYAQEHPGMLPPSAMFGRVMQKSMQQGALARGLGLPIGENVRDLGARGMTGFGNFRNQ
jgi:hypothetical protein